MKNTIRVGILFGGQSAEHEVSLQSAKNIIEAIDRHKYEVVLLGIDKTGGWHLQDAEKYLLHADDPQRIRLNVTSESLAVVPERRPHKFVTLSGDQSVGPIDVIFPILHGPYGEDGTVQGLLKLADIPFVGAGVVGSAVGMDKDVMKRLLRDAGIPIAKFLVLDRRTSSRPDFKAICELLGRPCFVKPANLGSSVGVSKVTTEEGYHQAVDEAFRYDRKVLIEEGIEGREIECAVLGNDAPIASLPGEVVTNTAKHQFYSYQAKYIDEAGAELGIPADLPEHVTEAVQELAIKTFQVLCCEGMARIDCFLTPDQRILINELNSIPGFTKISMYPKLWEASGISYPDLIDRLIQLALERAEQEKTLATSY
ncbi:D-alanine--D-alanine ligase [candidate division KSB3 bacterium]|uniref:D-alanine--D-alanine ligase n=1 Tax=candidate division KSB3 bacterium TaxID=2044937 RepID=A0A9D5JUT5_9BACT|nr:D-alanine--D-alanine ligase [candidate division KSB3 bacterium]MBD3324560.1 D-alanine--D-alanine ligase [candidate division KSB3 bacterium]